MGGYATNVSVLYDTIYEDDKEGVNLPDIWVNLPVGTWSDQESQNLCNNFEEDFPVGSPRIDKCEPRLVLDGTLFHTNKLGNEVLVTAVWHGIDEGEVDKVWIPDHECCEGRIAQSPTEIVLPELNEVMQTKTKCMWSAPEFSFSELPGGLTRFTLVSNGMGA